MQDVPAACAAALAFAAQVFAVLVLPVAGAAALTVVALVFAVPLLPAADVAALGAVVSAFAVLLLPVPDVAGGFLQAVRFLLPDEQVFLHNRKTQYPPLSYSPGADAAEPVFAEPVFAAQVFAALVLLPVGAAASGVRLSAVF